MARAVTRLIYVTHGEVGSIFFVLILEMDAWTATQVDLELETVLLPQPPQCWSCKSELPYPAYDSISWLEDRQSHVVYREKWTKLPPHWFITGSERLNCEHLAEKLPRQWEQLVQRQGRRMPGVFMTQQGEVRKQAGSTKITSQRHVGVSKIFQSWSATKKDFNFMWKEEL